MSETLDTPAVIEDAPAAPAETQGSIRDTMASVLAKYPGRNDSGQFESRAIDQAPDETVETTTDQPATETAEPAPPAIDPPSSWSAEQRAKWATLPPDVQAYVAQREADAHKAISEKGSVAARYEAAVGEHRDMLVRNHGSVENGINALLNLANNAFQRPREFILDFARQHQVDLSTIQPSGNPAAPADPINHLAHEVGTLKTQLQQQHEAQIAAVIREFSEAKDAAGKPARPHFDAVRGHMAQLMNAGIATSLEDAYDQATRLNGAVWAQIQAEESAARQAAEQAKAAKASADARRAASVNVKPLGSVSGSPVRGQTMRDTMAAVFRESMGQR